MRILLVFAVSLFFSSTIFSQEIEFGKYRLCYDMYWRCHFQLMLELKSDSTYKFTYFDDTQIKKTAGKWKVDSNFVTLTPSFIPDTIKITNVFETSNSKNKNNIISVSENYKGIPNLEVHCFLKGTKVVYHTDSIGNFHYKGKVIDSLSFFIEGRKLKVIPKKIKTPSIIRISIDSDYKDLVYQQLGINQISIQNGKMLVKYRDGENGKLKTEYFEKVE